MPEPRNRVRRGAGQGQVAPFAALAALLLVALPACSFVVAPDEVQCETNADCASRGFAGTVCVAEVCVADEDAGSGGSWACLGSVAWPASEPKKVTLRVPVVDVITSKPPEELRVRVCPKLDVDCASPLGVTAELDAQGFVVATVDAGFDGYLELTSPSTTPALYSLTRPVWEDLEVKSPLPVVSPEGFGQIAAALGATLDLESMGHTYALASDCEGEPAAGVRFEIDRQSSLTASYYMVNGVPVGTQTATDAAGSGGFLNQAPGFTRITGYVSATGARIGEAGYVVRKGAVCYPRVLPTP